MATLILPEDVIFQILIWLPVRSLLRFKSVCRSWYGVIQSSHFIERHAITTNMVDKNSKLGGTFICQHETLVPTPPLCLLSDKGFKGLEDLGKQECLQDYSAIKMVDSVHGIICMYNRNTRDIVLWNPATRQCRVLPKSLDGNPKDGYDHRDFVGLGFDVESKDYKVIQVSSLEPKKYCVSGQTQVERCLGLDILRKVQIYCVSTDSWRLIDSDFRTHCFSPAGGRSLNGIYFHQGVDYTIQPSFKTVILSFDLNKEKYQRVLQIPDDNFLMMTSIGDKLACITISGERPGFDKEFYTVWMLSDYDNTGKEFWTELYRVDVMSPKIQKSYIVAVLWNGELGLFGDQTLGLYNFITDEFEDLGFGEEIINLCTLKTTIYEESLVSVYAAAKTISSRMGSPFLW